jgi:hypothetical protein
MGKVGRGMPPVCRCAAVIAKQENRAADGPQVRAWRLIDYRLACQWLASLAIKLEPCLQMETRGIDERIRTGG